jgi:hypothetical protein
MLLPLLDEALILLHDVIVVEHSETKSMLKHFRLEILKHHVRVPKLFIGCHVFGVRNFTVKRHDRPKRITLGNQTQFPRRKIMIIALDIHHGLLNGLQSLLLQIMDRHSHNHGPYGFPVVEDA